MIDIEQIKDAYDALVVASAQVAGEWTDETSRSGFEVTVCDMIHHVCHAIAFLDAREPVEDGVRWLATHEAYLAVLGLGQALERARADAAAPMASIDATGAAVLVLLDRLDPAVSGADRGLRAILLDGEPLDAVIARMEVA